MAKRYDVNKVRDAIGALDFSGVGPKEIERRLHEDEAGLGYKVKIGRRQIFNYRMAYRAEHGQPPSEVWEDKTTDSIAKTKLRLVALLRREVSALERKAPGTITNVQSRYLAAHHKTLSEIEAREAARTKRKKATPIGRARAERQEPLTAIEQLAQREAEQRSEGGDRAEPSQDNGASQGDGEGAPSEATARLSGNQATNDLDGEARLAAQLSSGQARSAQAALSSAT
jgi:hypothetical protein